MRKNIGYSLFVHVVVLALGYFGLPALRPDVAPVDVPIMVEIVTVADKTNAPQPPPQPKSKPEPKKIKPKPDHKPEKKKAATPPPPPPAKPKPDVAAVPSPQPKPKAKQKPEVKKKKAPPKLARAKPKRKPKPPDAFASVLKTVEKLKKQPLKEKEKEKEKKKDSFEEMMTKAIISSKRQGDLSKPMTISEIDLVRQQIARCWNLPAGAKDAENLIIEIKVFMNQDGTVNAADIKNKTRMSLDGFYRSAAESALRAVLNRRCQPFKLPPQKYNRWKTMTLVFNPSEMF